MSENLSRTKISVSYQRITSINRKNLAAFSLIEIMIVLFIISLGMTGILSLIGQNIQSQSYNKNNLIAYQLAQEGVELIRRVRDSNWLRGYDHNQDLTSGSYFMDFNDDLPTPLDDDQAAVELFQNTEGFYQHDSGLTTSNGFSRLIKIEKSDTDQINVIVEVKWRERSHDRSYILETDLYNWRSKLMAAET